eukprot:CAMPEP_0202848178 /NCGR_PEP_ID=MMETSP1389-20130828/77403_1 /ASSEMBLY_ACC=CAM_ASM_000865 /TAXON_ID=302021 /ORGANISM="Rhodomonas sp., Strain CCMP768" /LENGTH=83 /DNA_ID=CAMNT_0049525999 /DNA_START=128 /DNA_END=376 /DNA_ORIENTATION=-
MTSSPCVGLKHCPSAPACASVSSVGLPARPAPLKSFKPASSNVASLSAQDKLCPSSPHVIRLYTAAISLVVALSGIRHTDTKT